MNHRTGTDRPWPDIHALVLDLDGTVYRGDIPLPGAFETLARCRAYGVPVRFVTNNSTQSREEFAAKLTGMGHPTEPEQIVNTAHATGHLLAQRHPAGTRVHVLGAPALSRAITDAGFVVADQDAAVVVVGLDRALTYDKLRTAVRLILDGAEFIATNPDRLIPHGPHLDPGAGTLVAAVEAATAHITKPLVVGKPEPTLVALALRSLGTSPANTVMVGDQLHTDVRAGQRAGLFSVLVTTGVPAAATASVVPDRIIADLSEIPLTAPAPGQGRSPGAPAHRGEAHR
ncbi:HAD-IIA family hydrolase [Streptomyces sp. NPDC056716]|uniref:HAD-IIA family hydrolase n=1 Tax=unclassified Streptomyces TaxID=2593676 RepID=UPI0036BAD351